MNRNEHLTPEESEQNYAPLIADLRTLYAQPEEDAQSLSRIQQRLANSYNQENTLHFSIQPAAIRKTREERAYALNSYENNLEKLHVRNRPWLRYFSTIAAVVFVSLLVGSMLLVFSHVRREEPASGPIQSTPMPIICNAATPTAIPYNPLPTPTQSSYYPTPSPASTNYPTPAPTPSISDHFPCATPTVIPSPTPTMAPVQGTPTPAPTDIPTPTPTPTPLP